MPTENFIAKLRDNINTPVIKFTYDGVDKSVYIQSIGEIRRNIDLMPGYVQITVDNTDGAWNVFLTNHQELTKKGIISFALCDFITYTGVDMSFHDNSPLQDTIVDSLSGFVDAGFAAGMSLIIIGSDSNNQTVEISTVTAGVITLIAGDVLTNEDSGDIITLNATGLTVGTEYLTLFTGYVIGSDYDYDTKSMTLTLRDRLSLALENKIESISGFVAYTGTTIAFHENGALSDTITDSANGFLTAGFKAGMVVDILDSVSNNKTVTIYGVMAGTITLVSTDDLTAEVAGANVTIVTPIWMNFFNTAGTNRYYPNTVSEIVWIILTKYGKLDSTASIANTDIDYTSWLAWGVLVDNGAYTIYDIGVVANGQACSDVLMKIAQLTESVFWGGGEGKIKFKYGRTAGSWRTYTDELLKVDWEVSMQDRINSITCKWGYCPTDDAWVSDTSGVVTDSDLYGPLNVPYTYTSDTIQDRIVFHNTAASAYNYMTARLLRTAPPPRYFTIQTQLLGFCQDVRDDIALQNLYADGGFNYDDIGIQINEITFIPDSWETRIVGQYIWNAVELA